MTRFRQPSKYDRHDNGKGKVVTGGGFSRRAVAAPTPAPGQHACPVCRNAVGVTTRGNLRTHADLFGNPCPNRSTLTATGIDAPPVVLPADRDGKRSHAQPREPGQPSRLDAGSECRECGKWLPGERSLCGRCYATGGRGR